MYESSDSETDFKCVIGRSFERKINCMVLGLMYGIELTATDDKTYTEHEVCSARLFM